MKLIYVHIGEQFPEYHKISLKQSKLVTDEEIFNLYGQEANELLQRNENNQRFEKVNFLNGYGLGNFWSVTLQRLFVLEQFMVENDLHDVIHIENDNLIFFDINVFSSSLKFLFTNCIALTPLMNELDTASFVYIPNYEAIKRVNSEMVSYLEKGRDWIFSQIPFSMVNEMLLLRLVKMKNPDFIGYLPTLPSETEGNVLFDPASYGQYLGGIPNDHTPGFIDERHYVGKFLSECKPKIYWVHGKLPYPYMKYSEKRYKFMNLHIHSKRLQDFTCF